MISQMYDFYDRPIWSIAQRCSKCYEFGEMDSESITLIEERLNNNGYISKDLLVRYVKYVTRLVNHLRQVRQEEADYCPENPQLEFWISRLTDLARALLEGL
ncbi:hypothetical protein DRJ48_02710 [Candidatus Woesearchaeota archaeon]|nr:MAG: hypothetical protein DRJ48_02710 [Candidatus Woesearchaeota archaeon]